MKTLLTCWPVEPSHYSNDKNFKKIQKNRKELGIFILMLYYATLCYLHIEHLLHSSVMKLAACRYKLANNTLDITTTLCSRGN
jgi:hypothetical protein